MQKLRQTKLDFSQHPADTGKHRDRESVRHDFQDVVERIQGAAPETEDDVCIMHQQQGAVDDTRQRALASAPSMTDTPLIPTPAESAGPSIQPRETRHPKISDVVLRLRQNLGASRQPLPPPPPSAPAPARTNPGPITLRNDPTVSVKEAEQRMLERIRAKKRKKNETSSNV